MPHMLTFRHPVANRCLAYSGLTLVEPVGQNLPSCPRTCPGLTLVEVLVALTLLALVILPIMAGFSQSLVSTNQSTIAAVATSLARQKLEQLKLRDYDALFSEPSEVRDLRPGDGYFLISTQVQEVRANDPDNYSGLKRLDVSVSRQGSASSLVTLTTYSIPKGV